MAFPAKYNIANRVIIKGDIFRDNSHPTSKTWGIDNIVVNLDKVVADGTTIFRAGDRPAAITKILATRPANSSTSSSFLAAFAERLIKKVFVW